MWIQLAVKTCKNVGRLIVAMAVFPIVSVLSLPKMIRIYLNPEIQSRHIFPRLRIPCFSDEYNRPPSRQALQRMKNILVAEYKISISHFRSLSTCYFMQGGSFIFLNTVVLIDKLLSYFILGRGSYLFRFTGLSTVLTISSISVFLPNTFFILTEFLKRGFVESTLDEILFSIKRDFAYIKRDYNPTRYVQPLILRANLNLGSIKGLAQALPGTLRPKLHEELAAKCNQIKTIEKSLSDLTTLPRVVTDLIIEYTEAPSLIFSSGKPIASLKFQKLEKVFLEKENILDAELDQDWDLENDSLIKNDDGKSNRHDRSLAI